MKPRVFIGSSSEQKELAGALATAMMANAMGVPWWGDVFKLGHGTVTDLEAEAAKSDFAIFIFAPDDVANIRGSELNVARDNVVYELGLFSGALGSNRCYILIASGFDIHLPSDLQGLTLGVYDPKHGEERLNAVTPFVTARLFERIRTLGFRHKAQHRGIYDLIVEYAACDNLLAGDEPDQLKRRLAAKGRVWNDMRAFCDAVPANKDVLLSEHHYVALAAAIVSNPEASDCDRILNVRKALLKRGDPQAKLVDAMIALRVPQKLISDSQKDRLVQFANGFTDKYENLQSHIDNFART